MTANIRHIYTESNVGVPGRWVYDVGRDLNFSQPTSSMMISTTEISYTFNTQGRKMKQNAEK